MIRVVLNDLEFLNAANAVQSKNFTHFSEYGFHDLVPQICFEMKQ